MHVPEVVPELSTKRLLTTTWQDGKKILTFVEGSEEQRAQLALNMFRAWYVPLYYYGVIHGDPHLGNYSVRDGRFDQPDGFRLRPGVPAQLRRRGDRAVPGAGDQ